jgi:DNA-binding CsgD family transcriptional regulator
MSKLAGQVVGTDIDVQEIAGLGTQFDVFRFMKRVVEHYGLRTFMILDLPAPTAMTLSQDTIITNWPTELISFFNRKGLIQSSFILRRLRQSALPFTHDFDAVHLHPNGEEIQQLFARHGIARGAYFPVHDAAGARGAVAMGGTGPLLDSQSMMELMYLSIHVFERLAVIRNMDARTGEILTERELDCLNWTAAGKTSAEIADILGLSEHTVNHYLNRAAKKLDTVNRTQAVAKALRIGLIK